MLKIPGARPTSWPGTLVALSPRMPTWFPHFADEIQRRTPLPRPPIEDPPMSPQPGPGEPTPDSPEMPGEFPEPSPVDARRA
jgi:hypothetical protein